MYGILKKMINTILPRQRLIANLVMITVIAFWGISFISIKIAVSEIPPTTMALIRFTIASILLLAILKRVEPNIKIDKKDIPQILLGGVLGITLYFCFENLGVKLTTASNASLIVTTVPIIAITLDVVFYHGRVSILKLVGIGMAIIGTYLSVTANGNIDINSKNFVGNMLMVGAMLSWALYTLVNKSLQGKYSGVFLTTYQTVFGTLCLIPLSLFEYREWQFFSFVSFCNVLFLAVCCSVCCYVLYLYVLKRLDVTITTLYLNLVPVVGVVSGYLILNERVQLIQLVGGALTIIAIIIVNFEQSFVRRL
jgi:drug/metabolite transporter (DMT)-like permease